jgi:hypothetical protein
VAGVSLRSPPGLNAVTVWSRLFGARRPRPRLRPSDVQLLAQKFLLEWPAFRERYEFPGPMSVYAAHDEVSGRPIWRVSASPATDLSCDLVVADDAGEVIEASLTTLRVRGVLAHWQR